MSNILVLHGPNLNLLGHREAHLYGKTSLEALNQLLTTQARALGHQLSVLQSNSESNLIDRIHSTLQDNTDFILFNPAGYTHTSIALRDALLGVKRPFIEIHVSNIYARESFRHQSYFSDIAIGVITGLGAYSYEVALIAADHYLSHRATVTH